MHLIYMNVLRSTCTYKDALNLRGRIKKHLVYSTYNDALNLHERIKKHLIYMYALKKSKVGDRSRGRPESSLFTSYYTEV